MRREDARHILQHSALKIGVAFMSSIFPLAVFCGSVPVPRSKGPWNSGVMLLIQFSNPRYLFRRVVFSLPLSSYLSIWMKLAIIVAEITEIHILIYWTKSSLLPSKAKGWSCARSLMSLAGCNSRSSQYNQMIISDVCHLSYSFQDASLCDVPRSRPSFLLSIFIQPSILIFPLLI